MQAIIRLVREVTIMFYARRRGGALNMLQYVSCKMESVTFSKHSLVHAVAMSQTQFHYLLFFIDENKFQNVFYIT